MNSNPEPIPLSNRLDLTLPAKLVGVGFLLQLVSMAGPMLVHKVIHSIPSGVIVIAGLCGLAAMLLLLIGALKGIYRSVRRSINGQGVAIVWALLFAVPLLAGIALLLLAVAGIAYRGP